MAKRAKHDAQVDPFNAGEPSLPWEDPEPLHEEAGDCALAGESYDGPTKMQDAYDAPSTEPNAEADIEVWGEAATDFDPETTQGNPFDTGAAKDGAGASRGETGAHRRETAGRAEAPRNADAAESGKQRGKRIRFAIKWIIVAAVTLNILPWLLMTVTGVLGIESPGDTDSSHEAVVIDPEPDSPGDLSASNGEDLGDTEELNECQAAVNESISHQLAADSELHGRIADSLEEHISYVFDCDAADLGVDCGSYADWAIENTNITCGSVSILSASDIAFADFEGTLPDCISISNDFVYDLIDYLEAQGITAADGDLVLTDVQKQDVSAMLDAHLADAESGTKAYGSVELTRVDGSWTVSDEEVLTALLGEMGI